MSSDIANCSQCFGLYDGEEIVGFCAVLHQPHGVYKKLKRCTRLVVLPDYQGIGLGSKLLQKVAEFYKKDGYDFSIVTSAKNLIKALNVKNQWRLIRHGISKCNSAKSKIDKNRSSVRSNCKTASFFYKG